MIDYDSILSKKVTQLKPSGIRKFFDLASEVEGVISLSVGEPDFKTPWHIREAGITSLKQGRTHYTANAGLSELRLEISKYLKRKINVEYDPKSEIFVTVGGSEAIDLAIRTIIAPGDDMLLPIPSFVCYDPICRLSGGNVVTIETKQKDDFRLTADALKKAITPNTKLLVLPYPNNPTGGVMRREHLEEIAEVLRGTNIMVLSDEIYSELTYGSERHVSIAEIDGMRERTIIINGFSKAYAMTGWRLGYACAPEAILKQMLKIHQFAIMCAPTTSQYAAVEAMKNGDEDVAQMREEYNARRRYVLHRFKEMGLKCFEPFGAFYAFPSIKEFGMTSDEFATKLLNSKKIAVVPGTAFGECGEGFLRISYAYSLDDLKEALGRIEEFVTELRAGMDNK